jgi:ribonuclease BN (tRNA processing enzyme)
MELVVLGSGTAIPHPKRTSAGFWLSTDGGALMLDFSASAFHRLAQERLDWANIDAVWISHFHLDHCAGLPPYLFAARHALETFDRTKPLRVFGGKGLSKLISLFDEAAGGKLLQQRFPIEIKEIEDLERFEILPGLTAVALSTSHTDESQAIRLEDTSGATLVYTSDTGFAKEIGAFSKNADLVIIESSFVRDKKTDIHLELAEAMYLIGKAKPKRAMLTHLYGEWDIVDFNDEVAKFEPVCEVLEAVDGLRLTVNK